MIFILGGAGFVGSALVRCCQSRGLPYRAIDKAEYADCVGQACRVLINANGNSKKYLAVDEPLLEFDQSVRSVRASLVDFSADYYVYISSCDVYPDCSSPQLTRETIVPDISRQSPYGFHKYLAEQCVRHASRRWLIVRLGGMVGAGLRKNPIFDILHEQPLWLDSASELQFMHTADVAETVLDLVAKGLSGEIVNVCGRGVVSLAEVAGWAGKPLRVQPGSPKRRYEVSIEKLAQWRSVPETRQTVQAFVQAELAASQRRACA